MLHILTKEASTSEETCMENLCMLDTEIINAKLKKKRRMPYEILK
jgi:hypothetical protein